MLKTIAACVLLLLAVGCSVRPADRNRVRIEYSLNSEYADSGYKVTILGNGRVHYESYRGFGVPGVQEYFVPQANVIAMLNALREAHFFSMPETTSNVVFDCTVVRIRYFDGARQKLVVDNCREMIPKHKRGQPVAEAIRSRDHEPGLWELGKELEHLADAERLIHPGLTDYALLVAEGWNVNTSGKKGWTALDYAVSRRDYLSARFLLDNGVIVSDRALIDASVFADQGLLHILLTAHSISQDGLNQATVYAARYGNPAALDQLLAAGANPNGDSKSGIPIFAAVESASGAAIEILAKHGADVNAKDEQGRTPLLAAAAGNNSGIVTELVRLGAQIDALDRQGNTALMNATRRCYYWTMRPLLEAGAVPDRTTPPLCGPGESEKAQRAASLLQAATKAAH
jgi:ankyrin repeat protein